MLVHGASANILLPDLLNQYSSQLSSDQNRREGWEKLPAAPSRQPGSSCYTQQGCLVGKYLVQGNPVELALNILVKGTHPDVSDSLVGHGSSLLKMSG